jgi:hypothetical protein
MYHLRLHITSQPNVFVGVLQKMERSKIIPDESKGATHNIRVGTKVPPPARTCWSKAHTKAHDQERTDFGGLRQCMEQKGNAFAIERSVGGITKLAQSTVLRRPEESERTRSIVRFAMRVPSYSAANRDDEYNVKTNNSSWPKATMSSVRLGLLGLGLKRVNAAWHEKNKIK